MPIVKNGTEVMDELKALPNTEYRLKMVYDWIKGGLISQGQFIQVYNVINLMDVCEGERGD